MNQIIRETELLELSGLSQRSALREQPRAESRPAPVADLDDDIPF